MNTARILRQYVNFVTLNGVNRVAMKLSKSIVMNYFAESIWSEHAV